MNLAIRRKKYVSCFEETKTNIDLCSFASKNFILKKQQSLNNDDDHHHYHVIFDEVWNSFQIHSGLARKFNINSFSSYLFFISNFIPFILNKIFHHQQHNVCISIETNGAMTPQSSLMKLDHHWIWKQKKNENRLIEITYLIDVAYNEKRMKEREIALLITSSYTTTKLITIWIFFFRFK